MKACPYCAEEIQDAAVVCRFCGRELVAKASIDAPATGGVSLNRRGIINLAVGTVIFGGMAIVLLFAIIGDGGTKRQILDVSGAKGSLGLTLTNRESDPVTDCTIAVLERGRPDEWYASVPRLGPMESASVPWGRFVATSGHQMPSYIGTSAKYFTVKCESHAATRQGAGLAFQE